MDRGALAGGASLRCRARRERQVLAQGRSLKEAERRQVLGVRQQVDGRVAPHEDRRVHQLH